MIVIVIATVYANRLRTESRIAISTSDLKVFFNNISNEQKVNLVIW
jgi:hypothetical protein